MGDELHLGDMIVGIETNRNPELTNDSLARGVYVRDNHDGTIMLRIGSGPDITVQRPRLVVRITDDELSAKERDWVPAVRRAVADASHERFELPGAQPLAEYLSSWLDGILEAREVASDDPELRIWDVYHARLRIGRYCLWQTLARKDVRLRSWFGRIPGLKSVSTIECNARIPDPNVPEDEHRVVWEDYEGDGTVMPLNPASPS